MRGGGTGSFVQLKGRQIILTNAHVCEGVKSILNTVRIMDYNGDTYLARIIDISPLYDLCAVEAPFPSPNPFQLATEAPSEQEVYVIGHPLLLQLTISRGWLLDRQIINVPNDKEISDCTSPKNVIQTLNFFGIQLFACFDRYDTILTNIPSQPGNSGSPVLNSSNKLVGILWGGYSGLHWAAVLPLDIVTRYLASIRVQK